MEYLQKRQKLYEYIDVADDDEVDALFVIIEADTDHSYSYSAEEFSMFYKRNERYLKGEGKSFSIEEAF